MARKKGKGTELKVFKGREARLNRVIFQALGHKDAQTIWDLLRKISQTRGLRRTRYATINKRVRDLEEEDFLRIVEVTRNKAGDMSNVYELSPKAYLATFLDSTNMENLLGRVDDAASLAIIGVLSYAMYIDE